MIETLNLNNACVTCSFQAEDVVVLHLIIQQKPDIPVLFLETGYHFPRDARLSRPYRGGVAPQPPESKREAERRRPGIAVRHPESDRSGPLLWIPQSDAAV